MAAVRAAFGTAALGRASAAGRQQVKPKCRASAGRPRSTLVAGRRAAVAARASATTPGPSACIADLPEQKCGPELVPLDSYSDEGLPDPSDDNTPCYNKAFLIPDWLRHRQHLRFVRHLLQSFSSQVMWNCMPMVFLITAMTAAIVQFAPAHVQLPMLPFTLTSFIVSLLVGFRTNQSYSRWWEARILWGGTVNNSRSLARETLCGLRTTSPQLCARGLRIGIAYVWCLAAHLQGLSDKNIAEKLSSRLLPDELAVIMASKHRPGACLHAYGQVIRAARERGEIDNITHLYLAERIHALTDGMGACERILRTPIPLSYTRHTSRFLTLWLVGLPFAVVPSMGWLAVPIMAVTSLMMLGLDEIGVQIEEPFRSLPLQSMCSTIEASSRGYHAEHDDLLEVMKVRDPVTATNGQVVLA